MCKTQNSVSHSSTESEIISLDAGLRMDGLPALDLWDIVIEVLNSTNSTVQPNQVVVSTWLLHRTFCLDACLRKARLSQGLSSVSRSSVVKQVVGLPRPSLSGNNGVSWVKEPTRVLLCDGRVRGRGRGRGKRVWMQLRILTKLVRLFIPIPRPQMSKEGKKLSLSEANYVHTERTFFSIISASRHF